MGKALLKGLSAGLGSIGQSMQQAKADKLKAEANEQQQANLDREFDLRKNSAELANQQRRQQVMQNEITMNMTKLGQVVAATNMEPNASITAMNKYGGLPFKIQIDQGATLGGQIGYRLGRYKKDADGQTITGDNGKPIFEPDPEYSDPSGDVQTVNKAGFADLMQKTMKPANQAAAWWYRDKQKADLEFGRQKGQQRVKDETQLQADTKQTALREAKIKGLEAEASGDKRSPSQDPVMEVEGLNGKFKKLTAAEARSLRDTTTRLSKKFMDSNIDDTVAFKIMQTVNDAGQRKKFALAAKKAIEENRSDEFMRIFDEAGLPLEFATELLAKAETLGAEELGSERTLRNLFGLID